MVEILSYRESSISRRSIYSIQGIGDWLPYPPWEGPPLPRFFPPWPWANVKKWVRSMAAKLTPYAIPSVDVYVLRAKMIGTFKAKLENLGEIALTSGDMSQTLEVLKTVLLNKVQSITPFVEPTYSDYIDFTFTVEGVWNTIQELWDYFWTGEIDIDAVADLYIAGRSEAEYDVQPLSKRYTVKARLQVDE